MACDAITAGVRGTWGARRAASDSRRWKGQRHMIRRFSILAHLTGLLVVSQPFAAQQRAIAFSELDRTVIEELKARNTPGAAVAVVIGDRVAYAKASASRVLKPAHR